MDPQVVFAMLAASLLHASWHALVKVSGDQVVALAGMNLVSGSVALCALPLVGAPPAIAFGVIAGSVALHVGYKIALARLYQSADLAQAYPLARGTAPLAAAGLGLAWLGERPSGPALVGLAFVSLGLVGLAFEKCRTPPPMRMLLAALAAGLAVAAYSVVDAYGVRLTGNWLAFTAWLVAADSLAFVGYAVATRGTAATRHWRLHWKRVLGTGLLGTVSFCVFMWALGRAPVGLVAALRETSIAFAALIGVAILGERAGFVRIGASLTVMAGVATIALSR